MSINNLNEFFGTSDLGDFNQSSFTLNTFRSEIDRGGIVRDNQFEVRLNPPPAVNIDANLNRTISVRCQSITIPGTNLSTTPDSNIYGPVREVVDGVNFAGTVDMALIADQGMRVRQYFEKWQQLAYNPQTWDLNYYEDYIGTIDVFLLNKAGQPLYGVRLWETFPKTFGPIELSAATTDGFVAIGVSMAFRYWTNIAQWGSQPPPAGGPRNTEITSQSATTPLVTGDPDFAERAAAQRARIEAFRDREARRAGTSPVPNYKSNNPGTNVI